MFDKPLRRSASMPDIRQFPTIRPEIDTLLDEAEMLATHSTDIQDPNLVKQLREVHRKIRRAEQLPHQTAATARRARYIAALATARDQLRIADRYIDNRSLDRATTALTAALRIADEVHAELVPVDRSLLRRAQKSLKKAVSAPQLTCSPPPPQPRPQPQKKAVAQKPAKELSSPGWVHIDPLDTCLVPSY